MGTYMRSRYNDPNITGTPLFPETSYDYRKVYSRSTGVPRTLQSSYSFLKGLFAVEDELMPVIFSVNGTTDLLGVTDAWPAVMMKRYVDVNGTEKAMQPYVDSQFTWEELQQLAEEAYVPASCTDYERRFHCCSVLYDVYFAFEAQGRLGDHPALAAVKERINNVWASWFTYIFGYDPDDSLQRTQGTSGQTMAQQLIQNMRNYMASPTYTMYEYSGHDTTVAPLGITLGDQSYTTMDPQFGVTIFLELLEDMDDGSYHVRALRGNPVYKEETGLFQFEQIPFEPRCMGVDGVAYIPAENTCPFDDFVRYVDSNAPTQESGYCVVDQAQYDMLGCPKDSRRVKDPSQLTHYCALYRLICPAYACSEGYILSSEDNMCHATASGASGEYDIRMTQVVHRHGARNPLVDENQTEICGTTYPCGELTGNGIEMLQSIGVYVRSRYNNLNNVEEAFFPERYNSSIAYSRSTNFQRTLQSAAAFLHGVFPDSDHFYPVIYTVNKTTDMLLNTDPMPPVMLKRWVNEPYLSDEVLNPAVDEYLNWGDMQKAAEEGYISGICSNYSMRGDCALNLYDVGTSFRVSERLGDCPYLSAALPGLTNVSRRYYQYVFGYDASNELHKTQGALAQNLAQVLIANMNAHRVSPSYKIFHYSTHDTMVAPLGVTLGDQGDETMSTEYGTTYTIELLQDTGDDNWHVRVLRGAPARNAEGVYEYVPSTFSQVCVDAEGNQYKAANNVCPLEDFARMVHSTAPSTPDGYCVVDETMYNNMDCPRTIKDNKTVPYYCQVYRLVCPTKACPENYVLNAADLQCYPTKDADDSSSTVVTPAPLKYAKPLAWTLPRMPAAKRANIAGGIVQGISNGLVMGAALNAQ